MLVLTLTYHWPRIMKVDILESTLESDHKGERGESDINQKRWEYKIKHYLLRNSMNKTCPYLK